MVGTHPDGALLRGDNFGGSRMRRPGRRPSSRTPTRCSSPPSRPSSWGSASARLLLSTSICGAALVVVGGALAWSVGTVVATRSARGPDRARRVADGRWGSPAGPRRPRRRCGVPASGSREVALILGLGIVGSAVPRRCSIWPLTRWPASEVSAWPSLIPVIGVLSAWALLGEQPSARVVLGSRECRSGCGWSSRGASSRRGGW